LIPKLVSLPPSIVRSLDSEEIDIVVENGTIKIKAVQENNNEG
jgi:hypothetical protein